MKLTLILSNIWKKKKAQKIIVIKGKKLERILQLSLNSHAQYKL